jgi:hypothetical protein
MEKLNALVAKMESVKEGVKAYVAGQNAIVELRVREEIAAAKVAFQAELEAMGQRAADADKRVADLMAGVDKAVGELEADADEVAANVAINTPAASEPAPSEAPAEAAVEAVSEEKQEGE